MGPIGFHRYVCNNCGDDTSTLGWGLPKLKSTARRAEYSTDRINNQGSMTNASLHVVASQYSISSLERVPKGSHGIVVHELFSTLKPLAYRQNITSLSLPEYYFHCSCWSEQYSFVPWVQIFTPRTIQGTYTESTHSHPLHIPWYNTGCRAF